MAALRSRGLREPGYSAPELRSELEEVRLRRAPRQRSARSSGTSGSGNGSFVGMSQPAYATPEAALGVLWGQS